MGWWGTFGATESLQFYPDSAIVYDANAGKWVLNLHLKNAGSASAVIYKIEISGVETCINTDSFIGTSDGKTVVTSGTVPPGVEATLILTIEKPYTSGTNYLVKIYTRAGNVYSVTVQAK